MTAKKTKKTADRNKVLMTQTHTFEPVYDGQSTILILGSFPSVKSRDIGFYYGHPQNRFWKVLAAITGETIPKTIEEKKNLLIRKHIALWDVIAKCDISGSSDSSIKNVVPNDVQTLINQSNVQRIYVNGKTAKRLYDQYLLEQTGLTATVLPSTSPANAAYTLERLIEQWHDINLT
jgi:hypoxanthine-DNA glycosylase